MVPQKLNRADRVPAEQTTTSDRIAAYQKLCEAELPGNPGFAFVGIFIALIVFMCLAVLPWVMSWLQDEGIIHPKLEIHDFGPRVLYRQRVPHAAPQQMHYAAPNQVSPFGNPRQE
jgi:hypothetical protein